MTITTSPSRLSAAARGMLLVMAIGNALVAINLHDPSVHLWLDNGQPWAFALATALTLLLALAPRRRKLAAAAGSVSLSTITWRCSTAALEALRDGQPADWLRFGIWLGFFGASWICWASIWIIVGISARLHVVSEIVDGY